MATPALSRPLLPRVRMAAAGIAMLVGSALFAQYALNIAERASHPATELVLFYGWFTIWTNTAVALIAMHAGFNGRAAGLAHPALLAASAVWIIVVGIVYNTLLAGLNPPPTLPRQIINMIFHIISPLAWAGWWLWLRPAGLLEWRHLAAVLPLPLAYCVFALWMGATTGHYAYFFIDVSLLGWAQTTVNIIGFSALFAGLMAMAIGWDRRKLT